MRPLFALLLAVGSALAAPIPDDARLQPVRGELQAIADGAAREGLPEALLTDKVREGLAKNVPPARIAQVVRALASSLAVARAESQPHVAGAPSPQLLKAIVDAHALGVRGEIVEVLAATKGMSTQTRAVEVLADFAQRGYRTAAAARVVAEVAHRSTAGELDRLAARAESLTAGGATRAESLDALQRSSAAGLGLDGAGELLRRGLGGDDGRGSNRETTGPRGPNGNQGNGKLHGGP